MRTHGRNGSRVLFLCALGRTSDWMEETRVEEGKGETYGWPRDMRACLGSFRRKYHRGAVDVTVMDVLKAIGIVSKYVTWVGSSWKVCWKSPSLAPLLRQSILYLSHPPLSHSQESIGKIVYFFVARANDQGTTWSKYWPGQRTVYFGPARSEPKLKKRRGKKDWKGKRAVH